MMSWLRSAWLRVRFYLFRDRFDREIEDGDALSPGDASRRASSGGDDRRRGVQRSAASLRESNIASGAPSNRCRFSHARHAGPGRPRRHARHSALTRLQRDGRAHVRSGHRRERGDVRHHGSSAVRVVRRMSSTLDRVVRLYATERDGDSGESTSSYLGYVTYARLRDHAREFVISRSTRAPTRLSARVSGRIAWCLVVCRGRSSRSSASSRLLADSSVRRRIIRHVAKT